MEDCDSDSETDATTSDSGMHIGKRTTMAANTDFGVPRLAKLTPKNTCRTTTLLSVTGQRRAP